jgi:melibiose permease
MEKTKKVKEVKPLKMPEVITYGVGALGIDLSYGLCNSFFFKFCNTRLLVSSTFLTIIVVLSRIWDGINDPMMGTIVDFTKTRWGKYRPWMFLGATLNSIVLVLMFMSPYEFFGLHKTGVYVFVAVIYLFWGMTFTMVDIPYWSMVTALTNDPNMRNVVSATPRLFSGIAQFIVSGGTILIVNYLGGVSATDDGATLTAGQIKGFPIWAGICAVIMLAGLYTSTFTTHERIITPKVDKFSLVNTFKIVVGNDQLVAFIFTAFTFNTSWYLMSAMGTYFFEIVAGNEALVTLFAAVCGLGQLIGLLIMPSIAKKFGKKRVIQTAFLLALFGDIIMVVISRFFLSEMKLQMAGATMRYGNITFVGFTFSVLFIPFAIFAFIACVGIGMSFTCQTVMLADIVDYGEYKTGTRNDSTIFSMKSFLLKFALTAQTLVTGLSLSLSKTDAAYAKFSADATLTAAQAFTSGQMEVVTDVMFIIPPVLALVAFIIFSKKYRLYGELEQKVNAYVKEKHAHDLDKVEAEA